MKNFVLKDYNKTLNFIFTRYQCYVTAYFITTNATILYVDYFKYFEIPEDRETAACEQIFLRKLTRDL